MTTLLLAGLVSWIVLGLGVDSVLFALQWRYLKRVSSTGSGAAKLGRRRALRLWLGRWLLGLRLAAWGAVLVLCVSHPIALAWPVQLAVLAIGFAVDRLCIYLAQASGKRLLGEAATLNWRAWGVDAAIGTLAALTLPWAAWLLPAGAAWSAIGVAYGLGWLAIYHLRGPTVIAGNRIASLADASLREELRVLCQLGGAAALPLPVGVLDRGPMATSVGARVDGFGRMRRIVLTQGLMKRLTRPQILAVVAHELAHARLHHLSAYYGLCGVLVLTGVTMGGWLLAQSVLSPIIVLALLYLGHDLVSWPLWPFLSALRRRFEYQADAFAIRYAGAVALASALRDLLAMNPHRAGMHPLYRCFYATHPEDGHRLAVIDAAVVLGRGPAAV